MYDDNVLHKMSEPKKTRLGNASTSKKKTITAEKTKHKRSKTTVISEHASTFKQEAKSVDDDKKRKSLGSLKLSPTLFGSKKADVQKKESSFHASDAGSDLSKSDKRSQKLVKQQDIVC